MEISSLPSPSSSLENHWMFASQPPTSSTITSLLNDSHAAEMQKIKEGLLNENKLKCEIYSTDEPYALPDVDTDMKFIRISLKDNKEKTIFLIPFYPYMKKQITKYEDAVHKSITYFNDDDKLKMAKIIYLYKNEPTLLYCDGEKNNFKEERKYEIYYDADKLPINQLYFVYKFFNFMGHAEHAKKGIINFHYFSQD